MPVPLTEKEKKEIVKDLHYRRETPAEAEQREAAHRAMPNDEQPWMVIFFGMLDYGVVYVAPDGSPESKATAEKEMAWWQDKVRRGLPMPRWTRHPSVHDFQIRQQWDLDKLTEAITRGYL